MKPMYWPALIVGLLLTVSNAYAAPACPAQPSNADGTTITSPAPDQLVTSPVTVRGDYFGSFEGVVPIQILDASGTVLRADHAMNECCKLAPYEHKVTFNVTAPTPACIVVYRESGADGSLTPLAQVPVTLVPAAQLPGTGAQAFPAAQLLGAGLALIIGGMLLRRRPLRQR